MDGSPLLLIRLPAVWPSDAARGPSTPSFDHLVRARNELDLAYPLHPSGLTPACLMMGHHFSISLFCKEPSDSGLCCSREKISCPISASRWRTTGSAKAARTA